MNYRIVNEKEPAKMRLCSIIFLDNCNYIYMSRAVLRNSYICLYLTLGATWVPCSVLKSRLRESKWCVRTWEPLLAWQ